MARRRRDKADLKRAMRLRSGPARGLATGHLPLDSGDARGDLFLRIDDRDERRGHQVIPSKSNSALPLAKTMVSSSPITRMLTITVAPIGGAQAGQERREKARDLESRASFF
jgi:hypothetical protein